MAGRSLPWWIAGTSIAATWFAPDAPLATAALVRRQGVFGNWLWWYEAAGILMLTFFYARLWRRAGVLTDAEVIELRYGGAPARALRGFSAVYQGLVKNAVVMGWVMLAMVKFSEVLLGWDAALTLSVCVGLALVYTVASGLWGVVVTDMLQFVAGMLGSITLAGIVLARFGGPGGGGARGAGSAGGSARPGAERGDRVVARGALLPVPDPGAVDEERAGRRVRCAAPLRDEGRTAVGDGVALVRLRGDGVADLALDRGRAGVAAGLPGGRGDRPGARGRPRTRVPDDDPRTDAGGAARADGRDLPGGIHEHDGYAPVLGGVVHGERRVPAIREAARFRAALRGRVKGGGGGAGGAGGVRGVADGVDSKGMDLHHRADRGGGGGVAAQMVLVAGERMGGDRGDGGFGGAGERAGAAGAGPVGHSAARRSAFNGGTVLRTRNGPRAGRGDPRNLHAHLAACDSFHKAGTR